MRRSPLMRCCALALPFLAAVAFGQGAPSQPAPKAPNLFPGMGAPKVKVAEWLEGSAVEDFQKDRVYVLEFIRTRSKPCRGFAKKFQDLSHKFRRRATFAAVCVMENDQAEVPAYVKSLGSVNYSLATDSQVTPKDRFGFMAENWLAPAAVGVPSIFIVGKDQKIAWFGNAEEAEPVLAQVLDNKWDVDAAGAKARAIVDAALKANEAWRNHPVRVEIQKIAEMMRNEEYDDALKELDVLAAMDAKDARVNPVKYAAYTRVMLHALMQDLDGFYTAVDQLYEACADDFDLLNNTAWLIADPKSQVPEKHWDVAVKLATRAVEVSKRQSAYCLDTLAWAYYGKGDKAKAMATEQEAIRASDDLDQEDNYQAALKVFQSKSVEPTRV